MSETKKKGWIWGAALLGVGVLVFSAFKAKATTTDPKADPKTDPTKPDPDALIKFNPKWLGVTNKATSADNKGTAADVPAATNVLVSGYYPVSRKYDTNLGKIAMNDIKVTAQTQVITTTNMS